MSSIHGNWATLLLPINNDETINYELFEDEIEALIDSKVSGIYSNGTAGEFFTLTEKEFMTTTSIFASKCLKASMPFQIGASYFSGQIMLERIEFAAKFRPTAIQVVLPEWFPLTNDEAVDYLKIAAKAANGIPLVLYNPPHAKRKLSRDDLLFILEKVPQIKSIKVADGDAEWYQNMKDVLEAAAVFVPGHHMATGIANGAKGSYSNVAELSPCHAQRWYELMLTDIDAALQVEATIRAFMKEHIDPLIIEKKHANFALDKYLAVLGNWCKISNRVRFPYRSVPLDNLEKHRRAFEEMVPFFQK